MEGLPAVAGVTEEPDGASAWILNFAFPKISLYEKHNHMVTYGAECIAGSALPARAGSSPRRTEVVDAHGFFRS
jgi:hypothetical protein